MLTPAEVQDEGLDRVLDTIVDSGATAISPPLGVYAPAPTGQDSREPPLDVSGEARLLDRPLWGRRELRRTMDQAGASAMALGLNGFAPPWSHVTGLDYASVLEVVQATRCKLFTFHWPMIVRWWSETLLAWNPGLDESAVLRAVQAALDLPPPPDEHRQTLAEYGMPRPDEPHPIAPEALTRKVNQAVQLAGLAGKASSYVAYVYGYRPAAEFRRVLEAVLASAAPGCWVQRYGYLSDEKLAIMRAVWPR